MVGHEVINSGLLAAAEGVAIVLADGTGDFGVLVLIAVVDVGAAMILKVLAGAFDAVGVTLPGCVLVLGWGNLPALLCDVGCDGCE